MAEAPFQRLSSETLLNITLFLNVPSIINLGVSCKKFSTLLANDLLYRRLAERDYGITYKKADTTWQELFKQLYTSKIVLCRHLSDVADEPSETKRTMYTVAIKAPSICELCKVNTATHLSMAQTSDSQECRTCLLANKDGVFPVQVDLASGSLVCFGCQKEGVPRVLGEGQEETKVKAILETLKVEDEQGSLDRRRKAEQLLYVQELRREDMSLKHYLVEKSWSRTWMLFRTREGSPLPGKITNHKLGRNNGTLDPNIRLPLDKYRPAPETHADIVSETLWNYLEKAYGVQGKAYSEDDLHGPEYVRLRIYFDDFKNSILSYP
ncbi:hypothetical protein CLU79DRAFT_796371 [Phycomyces nitens]|nr:hypothetical protein CLU79DRAFT_796371 [Phycomyces nitens]